MADIAKKIEIKNAVADLDMDLGAEAQNVDVSSKNDKEIIDFIDYYCRNNDDNIYEDEACTQPAAGLTGEIYRVTNIDTDVANYYRYDGNDFVSETIHQDKLTTVLENTRKDINSRNILGAKNFIPLVQPEDSINGITYTVAEDGHLILNGYATADSVYNSPLLHTFNEEGIFTIDCASLPSLGVHIELYNSLGQKVAGFGSDDILDGMREIAVPAQSDVTTFRISINNATTLNNLAIYPMLRLSIVQDRTFARNAMTNYELTDKINNLHSTFAELDDVNINESTLENGQIPVYNSETGKWENGSDTKVTQEKAPYNDNNYYSILFSDSTNSETRTSTVKKDTGLQYNPDLGTLSVGRSYSPEASASFVTGYGTNTGYYSRIEIDELGTGALPYNFNNGSTYYDDEDKILHICGGTGGVEVSPTAFTHYKFNVLTETFEQDEDLPTGVTSPNRVYFKHGRSIIVGNDTIYWKDVDDEEWFTASLSSDGIDRIEDCFIESSVIVHIFGHPRIGTDLGHYEYRLHSDGSHDFDSLNIVPCYKGSIDNIQIVDYKNTLHIFAQDNFDNLKHYYLDHSDKWKWVDTYPTAGVDGSILNYIYKSIVYKDKILLFQDAGSGTMVVYRWDSHGGIITKYGKYLDNVFSGSGIVLINNDTFLVLGGEDNSYINKYAKYKITEESLQGNGSAAFGSYSEAYNNNSLAIGEKGVTNQMNSKAKENYFAIGGNRNLQPISGNNYADSSTNNVFSVDSQGNFFSSGVHSLTGGSLNGVLEADGPRIILEDGAAYLLYVNGMLNTNNNFRGAQSYYIVSAWDSINDTDEGVTTTANALPHIIQLGTTGTACASIKPYVVEDQRHGASLYTAKYHSSIGIGSCTTGINVRWNLVKVLGSVNDF